MEDIMKVGYDNKHLLSCFTDKCTYELLDCWGKEKEFHGKSGHIPTERNGSAETADEHRDWYKHCQWGRCLNSSNQFSLV